MSLSDTIKNGGFWFSYANVEDEDPARLLMNLSHGYLKAAETIASRVESDENPGGIYELLPAMFNLHHGVELFLTGTIHRFTETIESTHDLKKLERQHNHAVRENDAPELVLNLDLRMPTATYTEKVATKGIDLRYIVNKKGGHYWPGIRLSSKPIIDASRDCRREFARIRRILDGVKGWSAFWEEGTFAKCYPERPFWFFCIPGPWGPGCKPGHGEHHIQDDHSRAWLVYEGEAITEENCFHLSAGSFPKGRVRLLCALNDLNQKLGERRL